MSRPWGATRTMALLLLVVVALTVLAVAAADPASAHDSISASSPSDGEVVDGELDRVEITYTEPSLGIEGTSLIRVTGPDGSTVSDETTTEGATASVAVEFATAGTYQVTWQNVSVDGHPISGRYSFTWNSSEPAPTDTDAAPTPTPSAEPTPTPSAEPPSADPESQRDDEGTPLGLILGIGVAVLALLAGAIYFVSKPRRPDGADPSE